ncbi:hypothetical protein J7E97_08095 [Streptomyces sp. ISL-66]|uniref:hypothetical protein n=1 Tax=Streptomyces sp. ISL-66 TaxID=2819186 RepID=UPI001BE50F56|nr:hypothetical protein [Streptomyces sp. ISL-66]MBT2467834.1 hypothetical protein [Streptomyces sp. ISL-66]
MGKTWTTRRRGDINDFDRWFKKGKTVYVINNHATNLAAQFEARTYSARIARGGGLFGGEGKSLLQCYGEVYETPPRGLRNLASPEPQVAGPLPEGKEHGRYLDRGELDQMGIWADDAQDRYNEAKKKGWR